MSHYVYQPNLLDYKAAYSDGYNDFIVATGKAGITLFKQTKCCISMYLGGTTLSCFDTSVCGSTLVNQHFFLKPALSD